MIRNIIFDMGNVLIHWTPKIFLDRLGRNEADTEILNRIVFESDEWPALDAGTLDEAEALAIMQSRLPEHLHEEARRLLFEWDQPLILVEGMEDLVRELKDQGYAIYLLSNASRRQHEYWDRIPASPCFSGTFISADYQMIKPDPVIYQTFFKEFDLRPEECLFIDDRLDNVEAAIAQGMDAIQFTGDLPQLRQEISQRLQ